MHRLGLLRDIPKGSPLGAVIVGTMAIALSVSGCEAQTPVRPENPAVLLTGREVHELQNSTAMDVSGTVEVGNDRYLIPKAPYVDLMEVGRGTPTAYHQAAITLRSVKLADQRLGQPYPRDSVTALIGFNAPRLPGGFPVPDDGWVLSEQGLEGLPNVDLWLDTRQCVGDRPPPLSDDKPGLEIRAVWTVADVPLLLSCYMPLTPTPNGRYTLRCNGGSERTPSGVIIRFNGLASLDFGCRAALETLASSLAYLPMIVADWREE
jgi:hypothetical protein